MNEALRVHHKISGSRANGPGVRAVLWVQGCTLKCPGCFNPASHDVNAGIELSVDELYNWILSLGNSIEGISISGGEPLQQISPLLDLLQRIKKNTCLSVLMFSGYTRKEIASFPAWPQLAETLDLLICGRFEESRRLEKGIVSSDNQELLFLSDRYSQEDLDRIPDNEIIIMPDGEIITSGIGGISMEG